MRLVRHHLLVDAMMAGMPDMMAAHLGIGVQRTLVRLRRLVHLRRLGRRRLGCFAGTSRKRGSGENRNSEQSCGNGLQHGVSSIERDHESSGQIAGSSIVPSRLAALR